MVSFVADRTDFACTDRPHGAGCAGQVNSKAMRNLFDAYDDNKDGNIDEGLPLLMAPYLGALAVSTTESIYLL